MSARSGNSVRAAGLLIALLSLTALQTNAQETELALEKKAADTVANFVQEARTQNKLPKLERIEDSYLRDEACKHAKNGSASWQTGSGAVVRNGAVALSYIAFSTVDPSHRAPELTSWATKNEWGDPRRFAVAICFMRTAEDPEGRYWIQIGTYMGATKSFFYRAGLALAQLWSR